MTKVWLPNLYIRSFAYLSFSLAFKPCIERNALGAIKSIASANLALSSSGTQKVSLDDAIRGALSARSVSEQGSLLLTVFLL